MEFEVVPIGRRSRELYAEAAALCIATLGRTHMVRELLTGDQVYGALAEGEGLVGMAHVYENPREVGSLYVAKIAVAQAFQRQGVGTGLIERIAEDARRQHYSSLSTHAMTKENEDFFSARRLGFKRDDPNGTRRDMSLSLPARLVADVGAEVGDRAHDAGGD